MLTNADCTLYKFENGGYRRYEILNVYWNENRSGNVLKSGLQTVDSTSVYLYSDSVLPNANAKDMLVKGICDFEFDNTSQKTISESMNRFRSNYEFITVMSVDRMMFGGLPHIEISGK